MGAMKKLYTEKHNGRREVEPGTKLQEVIRWLEEKERLRLLSSIVLGETTQTA